PTSAPEQPTSVPPTLAPGQTPVSGGNPITPPTPPMTEMPETSPTPGATPLPPAFANVKPILVPEITPNDNFYITTKNFIDPTVDGNSWNLSFKGLVDNPFTLNLADIKALPSLNRIETLACISNSIGGDLIGNTRWKGTIFRDLLLRAKPKSGVV